MTNKKILTLISLLLISFLMVGCFPTPTPPNGAPIITSDPITTGIVGVAYIYDVEATDPDDDKLTYSFTVMPSGMTIGEATGLINWTPPAKGDYDVTVKVSDGYLDITQSFTIVVREPELQLVGITVDPKKMTLFEEGEKTEDTIDSVKATYEVRGYGVDIPLEDCLFLTSDDKVATVEEKEGVVTVTAEGVGTADILVSYEGKVDTIAVTVIAVELDHITVLPSTIPIDGATAGADHSTTDWWITAYYNDETADVIALKDCTYRSDYPTVFNVEKDEDGVVSATIGIRNGEATITVSYEGKTDIIKVTVINLVFIDVTSDAFTTVAANNTVTITLTDGTFKAAPIVAGDFTFAGTDNAILAAATTFTRTSGAVVTITELGTLTGGTDNTVTVLAATQATQASAVAAVASTK